MVNFVLVYKPYITTMESEHYWTIWKNMCVFKRVLANKTNTTTTTVKLHSVTISYSAITYVTTTVLVTILTYLLLIRNMLRS